MNGFLLIIIHYFDVFGFRLICSIINDDDDDDDFDQNSHIKSFIIYHYFIHLIQKKPEFHIRMKNPMTSYKYNDDVNKLH